MSYPNKKHNRWEKQQAERHYTEQVRLKELEETVARLEAAERDRRIAIRFEEDERNVRWTDWDFQG